MWLCVFLCMNCDYVIRVVRPCKSNHTGKENYPTRAWNVCVAHTTRILNVHGHKRVPSATRK